MATSSGYCYSDASSNYGNPNTQTHSIHNFDESNPGIYNLATSTEMMGLPPKNLNQLPVSENNSISWKQHGFPGTTNETLMVSSPWNIHNHNQNRSRVEDLSQMSIYTKRPTRGLSLSMSSSSIELQSFELGRQNDELRFGPSSSIVQIRNSKYLKPAQELLYEFCNIEMKLIDKTHSKMNAQKSWEWPQNEVDLLELQKKKIKLLQMLQELDKRYKHYGDQMKAVVQSFEAVAGNGAATVYTSMASTAMSRHFRCLKDGIVNQIKAIKKAMGEKDTGTPAANTSKGETPRLRLLEQQLSQQRAYQQTSMIESHPWRPQRGLPGRSVSVLRAWLFEHFLHPYPSDVDKHILARQTGLSRSQVSNWFINARVRLWKPMVEEMYLEDQKEQDYQQNQNPNPTQIDEKPTQDQLDSESLLSSIINTPGKKSNDQQQHGGDGLFGAMQFDFSSYSQQHSAPGGAAISYHDGGGGVTLTLGLQQQQQEGGSGGISLAYSSASQSSLFYHRSDQIDDCQTVHYSVFDSENQNLPYRNLTGAQLLHDLAG